MAGDPLEQVRVAAGALNDPADLDGVVERARDKRFVLIGEATHGTSEFYRWRAELTKRLIAEHGFSFVGVEGDWPDCHRLHCSVTGAAGAPSDPVAVLWGFQRWPRWMWANEEVEEFARWLRSYNASAEGPAPVGSHGLDVYSLRDSLEEVLRYLREHRPEHVDAAMDAYRCFEPYRSDPQDYAFSARMVPRACEREVVDLLSGIRSAAMDRSADGLDAEFVAHQNAAVVAGAERYYRAMFRADHESWNVRDHHMADTLDRLVEAYGAGAKAVVWAHNTHVGDARATDMAAAGMVNLGQLVRERHGAGDVFIVGFGSHRGSVIASDFWGGPVRSMTMPDARAGSVEALVHDAVPDRNSVFLFDDDHRQPWSSEVRGHRAIGVVYRSGQDRHGNYVPTVLDRRYDAFLHCDTTSSLLPLHDFATVRGSLKRSDRWREGGA